MYQPPHFCEENRETLVDLIRRHPLAAIVVAGPNGFEVNHVPCLIDPDVGPHGRLRLHVARPNPLRELAGAGLPVVAIFQGEEAYVTPSWYETKRETGKVVPTWNYAVVHAHGRLSLHDDPSWLAGQIATLTDAHEASRAHPWAVSDAPADYMRGQMKGIVGIEIAIERLEGKWKVSQNRPAADRRGVIAGLESEENGQSMAALVKSRGTPLE
jgi:transcriptional regulator